MRPTRVFTFGEGLGVLRTRDLGSLAHVNALTLSTGGAESNVAIGLARLETPVVWLGRVGDDSLGRRVTRELRAEGVAVWAVVDPTAPTGLLIKESPSPGRTVVTNYRFGSAGSHLAPQDLERLAGPDGLGPDDLLHVTGITPALSSSAHAALEYALDLANQAGSTITFDVNHRPRLWPAAIAAPIYRSIATRSTVVFAGEDEARLLSPEPGESDSRYAVPTVSTLAAAISQLGPAEVVIKQGAAGAYALVEGHGHSVDAVGVDVLDTVGAGDAFVAGYLAERIAGLSVDQRLATASKAGGLACTNPGDWEGSPTRAGLLEFDAAPDSDPVRR